MELHPFNTQPKLVRFCREWGLDVVGFSPLGAGSYLELNMATKQESVLLHDGVKKIAAKYNKTPAQVVLRWAVQRGCSAIPKSSSVARMKENICVFDFSLDSAEMALVAGLNCGKRFNDPGVFCEGMGCFCPIYD